MKSSFLPLNFYVFLDCLSEESGKLTGDMNFRYNNHRCTVFVKKSKICTWQM